MAITRHPGATSPIATGRSVSDDLRRSWDTWRDPAQRNFRCRPDVGTVPAATLGQSPAAASWLERLAGGMPIACYVPRPYARPWRLLTMSSTDRPASGSALSRRTLLAASAMAGLLPAGLMSLEQARAQGVTPKRGGTLTSLLNARARRAGHGREQPGANADRAAPRSTRACSSMGSTWRPGRCWPGAGSCRTTSGPTPSTCRRG